MTDDLKSRIDVMFRRDRMWAYGFVLALWGVVLLVLVSIHGHIPNPGVEVVCWIAAAVLLLFNTASVIAMVRHYDADRDFIYGTDIKHLDAGR